MYKLKKLDLLGFKSFADRTRLQFGEGTVAIVGPNGCGKSNLADAISWVLGEQSAKLLRGERMVDVIFNGTGTRPSTGMAEVSLTLVDPEYEQAGPVGQVGPAESAAVPQSSLPGDSAPENGSGPAEPHRAPKSCPGEITVSRRLFRSGESEYLINGEICRLRDVQDLFMGMGLGPDSYAIIEQGRIGQVLSSKPADRRAIIEEAAGVSKFKTRKRLAEAKLESSRQNLARIADILEEVSKQVNSLKRQASKARRYRELQEELRNRLRVVLASKLHVLESECGRLRGELAAIGESVTGATEHLDELDREQKGAAARVEELEQPLDRLRDQMGQSELERGRLESRGEQLRQQSATLEARILEATQEIQEAERRLTDIERDARERSEQAQAVRAELAAAQSTFVQLSSRHAELVAQLSPLENALESARQATLAAVSQGAELRNQLIQAEEASRALERQTARGQTESDTVREEQARLRGELDALRGDFERNSSSLAELERTLAQTARQLEQARADEARERSCQEALRDDFARARARQQALEEALAQHAYSSEGVRRLLSANRPVNGGGLPAQAGFKPLGVLADFLEVTGGHEEVVEEFLRRELDCVVVERHIEARSGIALLRSEGAGRSTFFVTQVPPATSSQSAKAGNGHSNGQILKEPRVLGRVRDLVRFEERLGLNGDLALPALENAYLVQDEPTGEWLAARYPECHFLTPSGEHYHHRLVSGGNGSPTGPLALKRDLRQLQLRAKDLESELSQAESRLADATARVTQLEEESRRAGETKVAAEKKTVVGSERLRQAQGEWERSAGRLETLSSELRTLDEERRTLEAQQADLRAQLQAAAARQASAETEVNGKSASLRELREKLEHLAEELTGAQVRSSALEERAAAAEAEPSRLAAQAEEVRARAARLDEQRSGWRNDQVQVATELEALQASLGLVAAAQQQAREERQRLEQEFQALRARRDEIVPQVEAARAALEEFREKRTKAEVALARAESDREHSLTLCRTELHTDPAGLLAELSPEGQLAGEALQAAEMEVGELKARFESLGPVNMMALEELQEAEERYQFLETQRQDLLASIEDTQQAIREIDQVSRQQLLEAFRAINEYFAESFRTLFGGGVGQMRFTDETDPDSGLDIVAQPPGKRLQNVLLLSGGEKALAALALLIAIFRYTPSPFCILDEVDAPLDESNVQRFTRMIQRMSRHTQFILITHNTRTMEMAQAMYGVTMEDPGVSKLVSVRFGEAERELATVSA